MARDVIYLAVAVVIAILGITALAAFAFLGVFMITGSATQGFGVPAIYYDSTGGVPSIPWGYENGDYVKGYPDAPVTIIEYSDFQCPYCRDFHTATLPQIEENFIRTGKARLVYRHYPLYAYHPQAQKAAEAAECAGEQDMFWEMHDRLLENQQSLSEENYVSWASGLSLDAGQFSVCLSSGKYAPAVASDVSSGDAVGVTGTPTFVINGNVIRGAQSYETFRRAIAGALGLPA